MSQFAEPMPEFKEGYMTLWRDGKWVQVSLEDMPKIMEEDNSGPDLTGEIGGTQESSDVSTGA